MQQTQYSPEEVARLGHQIYQRDIRDKVMPQHKGKFLVLDIESGDYEIDEDDLSAEEALRAQRPDGVFFGLRIGYTSAYTLAGGMVEENIPQPKQRISALGKYAAAAGTVEDFLQRKQEEIDHEEEQSARRMSGEG